MNLHTPDSEQDTYSMVADVRYSARLRCVRLVTHECTRGVIDRYTTPDTAVETGSTSATVE